MAITQRRVHFAARGEEGDYLDTRWWPLLAEHRAVPVPNDLAAARRLLAGLPLHAIVLSGGNDLPTVPGGSDHAPTRETVEAWLLEHAAHHHTPVIGICHGAQVLAHHAGAQLADGTPQHAGTTHQVHTVARTPWKWPPVFTVDSHHRHVLPTAHLPPVLRPLALADDGTTVEAFTHQRHPWWGLMWHPEREQPPAPARLGLHHLLHHAGPPTPTTGGCSCTP